MPQGNDTQFWDIRISHINYKNISADTKKMQLSWSNISLAPHEEMVMDTSHETALREKNKLMFIKL